MKAITTINQLAVEHDYYCSESNYYSNDAHSIHETFSDFYDEMGKTDEDMNLCFRWDILPNDNGTFRMLICIMHQRKGRYWPNEIELVTDEDVPLILEYLNRHHKKIKQIWLPLQ